MIHPCTYRYLPRLDNQLGRYLGRLVALFKPAKGGVVTISNLITADDHETNACQFRGQRRPVEAIAAVMTVVRVGDAEHVDRMFGLVTVAPMAVQMVGGQLRILQVGAGSAVS